MRRTAKNLVLISFSLICLGFLGLVVQGSLLQAPSSGTWAPAPGAMAEARANAAAAALWDGSFLVTGGDGAAGSAVSSAEVFGLDGSFYSVVPMSFPRSRHVAVALKDGRVLVAGGVGADGNASNSAEIFDPTSGAWQAAGAMLEPRADATATRLSDGRVLIAGGANGDAASMTLEVFDPVSDSFVPAGVMSTARKDHAAALLAEDNVLLAGGSDGASALASTEVWDAASGAVLAGPALSVARSGLSATTLLDGSVLIAGGAGASGELGLTEVYSPATGLLELASSQLGSPRQKHLAIFLPHNSAVLFVGGTSGSALGSASGSAPVSGAELFMPWAGGFQSTGAPSAARSDAAASTASEGLLVVAGGKDAAGALASSAEVYGFATIKTDKDDYAPGEIVTITGGGWESGDDVILTLHETNNPEPHPDRVWIVTADANGNLFDNSFYPEEHDLGIRFMLTAEGARSQAQSTFTDNKELTVAVAGTGSGTVTTTSVSPAGGSINCTSTGGTASGTCSDNGFDNNANVTLTATPTGVSTFAGWAFTTSPNPLGPPLTPSAGCSSAGATCSFGMNNKAIKVTATFNPGAANKLAITSVNGGTNPTAGTAFSVVVKSQDSNGNLSNVVLATGVTLSLNTGTGTLGGTVSGTILAGTNTVTIAGVTYNKAESGVILTATRTSGDVLASGNSAPFTVDAGALDHFVFDTISSPQIAGEAFDVTITAYDVLNNVVTSFSGGDNKVKLTSDGALTGAPITTAAFTNGVLTPPQSVTITNTGTFTITATGISGNSGISGTSNSFEVESPCTEAEVTTNPSNQSVVVNEMATFTAAASGDPAPTVQWQVSTDGGLNFSDMPGETSTTLNVTPSDVTFDGNQYRAVFTNTCGGEQTATTTAATLTVTRRTTSTSVAMSPTDVAVYEGSTATVTVTDTESDGSKLHPTGNVAVTSSDGTDTVTGTCNLAPTVNDGESECTATVTPTVFGGGSRTITGTFSQTSVHAGSSGDATLTVHRRSTSTGVELDPSSVVTGQSSTVKVTVTDTELNGAKQFPTGTVALGSSEATDVFTGTCTLGATATPGVSTCSASVKPIHVATSPHSITATFSETSIHAGSNNSPGQPLTVTKASTTTTVTSSNNPSILGESVSFTATVAAVSPGSGTPTGTVQFYIDAVAFGSPVSLSGDPATGTSGSTSTLTAGHHNITAVYSGSDDYFGSDNTASPLVQTVEYNFAGLFEPYGPPPRAYRVKSAIPLKWQYTDVDGNVVPSSGALPAVEIIALGACGGAEGDAIIVDDAGASGYQYDVLTNTWQFNWKTTGLAAGCYNVYIKSNLTGQINGPFPIQLKK